MRASTERRRDLVCGLGLTGLAHLVRVTHAGTAYDFCSEFCASRFRAQPRRYFGTPLIKMRNVTKTYNRGLGATHALRGMDVNIWEGDFLVIIGASGSGKSTVLNMIGLLDRPTSGRIWIKGQDVSALSEDERAHLRSETFGFIFQQYNLIPWLTAYENAILPSVFAGRPVNREWFQRTFAEVGLGERSTHRPFELSGGEQQRAALIRALSNNPAIVLGDEPTGNLDSVTGSKILQRLMDLNRQEHKTLVIVSHDAYIAAQADQIIVVHDGVSVQDHRHQRHLAV